MSDLQPLKLAILWHMHQPDYQQPGTDHLILPWVRLHATKDYLDMPLRSAKYDKIKTTFNLVPSLLDQLELYLNGGGDRHLDLSRAKAEELNEDSRRELLESFFTANPAHMIEPHPRYWELYRKARAGTKGALPALFTSAEIRDIQIWSNLTWVDPMFRAEEPIRSLLVKAKGYTEEDKEKLLAWQLELMKRVMPGYRQLFEKGRIDISFTPYYHPILPLLCDTDIAREAMPDVKLPKKRFIHPEDARRQIEMSMEKFEAVFGKPMKGMWPSEGSVSEEVAAICLEKKLSWIATDEDVLYYSQRKANLDKSEFRIHQPYDYGPGLKMFFRDRALSDRVGFVYSGWDADRAVDDFITHLKDLRKVISSRLDRSVVSVILDGENAWEYFPDDGSDFIDHLYLRLSEEPEIETVTMTEAAETIKAEPLPKLFAGSWINHNFKIWIGHAEDNSAWDLLGQARETLVSFEAENKNYDQEKIKAAWRQIYKAEGSDWCWWYGEEHRGNNNEQFDRIFRQHLISIYELLDLKPPQGLFNPIYQSGTGLEAVQPETLFTPGIDGRLTHYYEWTGAGSYDCLMAGGAMHRGDQYVSAIYFGYDQRQVFIRLDFTDKKAIELLKEPRLIFTIETDKDITFELKLKPGERLTGDGLVYCFKDILEAGIERSALWSRQFGNLKLFVSLHDGDHRLEGWPSGNPISVTVAEKDKEMFWPS